LSKRSKARKLAKAMAVPERDRLFLTLRRPLVVQADAALADLNASIAGARAHYLHLKASGLISPGSEQEARDGLRRVVGEYQRDKERVLAAKKDNLARLRSVIASRLHGVTSSGAPQG